MSDLIQKSILHYKILEKIGQGGMGVVYKAEDTRLKRSVAIKFLPVEIAGRESERERFKVEAQAAAALSHANIAHIYAIEEEGDQVFIVMEYIDGRELKETVASAQPAGIAIDDALKIAIEIARGLEAAHKKQIVHRDIKSSNIMITDEGQAKIMDFGLAKVGSGVDLTKDRSTLGTAAFMSPEQAKGEAADHRSDIWSFGVVMYEMLTGHLPFQADYEQAAIYAILNEEPKRLDDVRPEIPEALARVVEKALAKDPSQRYQNTSELLDDLTALHSPGREAARPQAARRKPVFWIAPIALLLLVLLYWQFQSDDQAPVTETQLADAVAVLPFSIRGSQDFAYLGDGMVDLLSTKLDGVGGRRSVDSRAVFAFVEKRGQTNLSPDDGRAIATQLKSRYYVSGNLLEAGGRLQISASLWDLNTAESAISQGTVQGQAERLFELVDELAAQLLVGHSDNPSERVAQIAAVTTHSLPALKAYLEGERTFREGRFSEALAAFTLATEIDSTFALAWYRLSLAAEWNSMSIRAHLAAEKGFSLSDRLSEHDRYLLEAFNHWRNGDATAAEQLYRTVVGIYPDDIEAWFQLGEVLFHQGPISGISISASRPTWERVLDYEPDHLHALWHLARIPAREGNVAELNALVDRITKLNPVGNRALEMAALRAFVNQDSVQKDQVFENLAVASDQSLLLAVWNAVVYSNKPLSVIPAVKLMTDPMRSTEIRVLGHKWLAYLDLLKGRWSSAQRELTDASALQPATTLLDIVLIATAPLFSRPDAELSAHYEKLTDLDAGSIPISKQEGSWFTMHDGFFAHLKGYLQGVLAAKLQDESAAQRHIAEFEGLLKPDRHVGTIIPDMVLSIKGQLEMARGNPNEAFSFLQRQERKIWYNYTFSSPFFSQAYDRFQLADLASQLGRHDEALRWFNSFVENSTYDLIYLAPSHLKRAQIHQSLGNVAEAIHHYERFIYFWQNCDADLRHYVVAAEAELGKLRKQQTN